MSDKNNPSIWIQKIAILLKPSRTIPHTPWRAESTWSLGLGRYHLERLLILIFGLTIFGLGDAFLIMSTLGNSPWTVLAEGISLNTPLNIGESTFIISVFSSDLVLAIYGAKISSYYSMRNYAVVVA